MGKQKGLFEIKVEILRFCKVLSEILEKKKKIRKKYTNYLAISGPYSIF